LNGAFEIQTALGISSASKAAPRDAANRVPLMLRNGSEYLSCEAQLAEHAVMMETNLPILANEIDVH
jgi:hypothetical protein